MRRWIRGICLLIWLASGSQAAEPPQPVIAAIVNGEEIPLSRVDDFIRTKLAIIPVTDSELKRLRAEVLNDLIDDVLLRQYLAKHAPKVEPGEIDRQLAAFAESLSRKGSSLAKYLKETRQTEAELRESWTLTLRLDHYVRETITEDQLKQYHAANKEHFDRAEVKVSHILIRVSSNATPVEKAGAKEKLQAIRKELANGKLDFAAAARKHSQCPSAAGSGDLGWLTRKASLMDEAFCKAAFALKKPGEIGGPYETELGYHLILMVDRRPGTPSVFEKCAEEVRELYADDLRAVLASRLRKEAQVQNKLR